MIQLAQFPATGGCSNESANNGEGGHTLNWYRDGDEFCAALETLLGDAQIRRALGEQGRQYVEANYRWPLIMDAYSEVVESLSR